MFEVIIEGPAEKFIKSLSKKERSEIYEIIGGLAKEPFRGKVLVGRLSGLRSLRSSNYRVIYRVQSAKLLVLVLRVGHRKDVYSKGFGKK